MDEPIPLYYQVAQTIREWLADGTYSAGDPIPPEPELQRRFGVSRLTVRDAVQRLVAERLLEKRQGKGTFVAKPTVNHRKGFLYSPAEEILARQHSLTTDVIEISLYPADIAVAEKLRCAVGEKVAYLKRLRHADGTPAQIIKSYLPYRLVPGIEGTDFRKNFLYKTLEDRYALKLKEADEIIEATRLSVKDAALLKIRAGEPVLLTKRWTYLLDATIIEYNEILYRPNVLTYSIKLENREQSKIIRPRPKAT